METMEKISVSDLSIGDWVRVISQFDAQIYGYHCESGSLSLKTRQGHLVYYRLEDINPIPLTPEILEKNGWSEFSNYHNSWSLDIASDKRVWMFKNSHDWTFQVMSWGLGHNHSVAKAYIKDIHELQRALRLAKVEKEIVL